MQFLLLAGACVLGMAAGLLLPPGATTWAAALLCAAAAARVLAGLAADRRQPLGLALLCLCCATGVLWAAHARRAPDADSPLGHALASGAPVRVAGVIRAGPDALDLNSGGARLLIDLETVAGTRASGQLEVFVARGVPDAAPGDVVALVAALDVPIGFANPGAPDGRLLAAARGVVARTRVARAGEIRVVARGSPLGPRRMARAARQAMRAAIEARLSPGQSTFLRTAVLGERAAAGLAVEAGFKAAGATHALSVSGLHLAAVAGLLFFILRTLWGRMPALALRVPPGAAAAWLSMPAVFFYTLLSGEAIATWRSALMAVVGLGALASARAFSFAHAIAWAALLLLWQSPLWLLDLSFQLSFVSVMALALFAGPMGEALAPQPQSGAAAVGRARALGRRMLRFVAAGAAASVTAGLLTAPLVAHHFGEFTPAAPVGNLLLTPLVELAVVPLGLLGAVFSLLHSWLGLAPLWLAGQAVDLTLWLAEGFRLYAPVWRVRYPTAFEAALLVVGAGFALRAGLAARLAGGELRAGRARFFQAATACLLLAVTSGITREVRRRFSTDVRVTFLDVGQGDAALIEGPRGFVALVDAGGLPGGRFDPGARVILPLLGRRAISHLDLLILSHPHPDHMSGMFALLDRLTVGTLWTSGDRGNNPEYDRLLALARQRGVRLPVPHPLRRDGLSIEPLGPWIGDAIAPPPGLSVNDASLTVRLSYAGRSIVFAGDIEEAGELELAGRVAGRAAGDDVLKVPHHGSRTSSSDPLLDLVKPRIAVISCGRRNQFHFPHPEPMVRYRERGIQVLSTDHDGALTMLLSPDGIFRTTCELGCR